MSPVSVPRSATIIRPSGDHAKRKMVSDVKFVNCFGGLPSRGCSQTFDTPSRLSIKLRARPSGVHQPHVFFTARRMSAVTPALE